LGEDFEKERVVSSTNILQKISARPDRDNGGSGEMTYAMGGAPVLSILIWVLSLIFVSE
jgi:hypothetical protein